MTMTTKPIITVSDAVTRAGRGDWDWYLASVTDIQKFLRQTWQAVTGEPDITPTNVYLHDTNHPLGTYVGDIWWTGADWDISQLDVPTGNKQAYSWQAE